MGFVKEFKEFAMRGNIVDLAVGLAIGTAFGKIVEALTASIIAPILALIMGKGSLSGVTVEVGNTVFPIGLLIQAIIDFVLIALVLFLILKAMNSMKKKQEAAAPPPPPEDITLLREIRDALKK
jgi:large conductance mechanosensitive channel